MATKIGTTVNSNSGSASATHTVVLPSIAAGDGIIVPGGWENQFVLMSAEDDAGGSWSVRTQKTYAGGPSGPCGAISRCLSHPGSASPVTITLRFATVAAPTTPAAADPFLSANAMVFRPASGKVFADGVAWTPAEGAAGSTFALATEATGAPGVVVEFLAGYQFCTGVTAGGTPAFSRDTDTENAGGTTFAQYLLSGSAQNVTPGASWGALGAPHVFLAYAMEEVDAGAPPAPPSLIMPPLRPPMRFR